MSLQKEQAAKQVALSMADDLRLKLDKIKSKQKHKAASHENMANSSRVTVTAVPSRYSVYSSRRRGSMISRRTQAENINNLNNVHSESETTMITTATFDDNAVYVTDLSNINRNCYNEEPASNEDALSDDDNNDCLSDGEIPII